MKKTNTAKKAVLPALLAVLCSTAALTSVSYAWFTLGNEASVGEIDVNVQSADGLQISHDAATWVSILDASKLTGAMPTADTKLMPVSTVGKITDGAQEFFFGEKQSNGTLLGKNAVLGTDYIMFDLYVKVESAQPLSIDKTSSVTDLGGKETHLASRVSFVDLGSVAVDEAYKPESATKLNGMVEGENKASVVIWEPNSSEHTSVATAAGAAGKVEYQGVSSVANASELSAVTYADVTTSDNSSGLKVADLEAGVNKLRVYIWLEGQDVDCTNEISAGSFRTKLNFSVPKKENA